MSRWDRSGWYRPAPKKPPPERGIRVKGTASTWWGQRWLEALERMSRGYANRLARGRTYARAGRAHDLAVEGGEITARVTGSRPRPYEVRITLAKLSGPVWTRAIAAMAGQAAFAAELLAGHMPQEIDAAFRAAGASLFPERESALRTQCSCPDWANPCKHIAATHYVLGAALDRDPFLLFELRGRSREQVLEALRAARAGSGARVEAGVRTRAGEEPMAGAGAQAPSRAGAQPRGAKSPARRSRPPDPAGPIPAVALGRLAAADYDQPREPLATPHLSFEEPPISGALLRQLGKPAGWQREGPPLEMLGATIRAAAAHARRLAMTEAPVEEEAQGRPEDQPKATAARASATGKKARKKRTTRRRTAGKAARKPSAAPRATRAPRSRAPSTT